jgi:hypothetical protein
MMPQTIRPFAAGHRPQINGSLALRGSRTIWRDLEICYTGPGIGAIRERADRSAGRKKPDGDRGNNHAYQLHHP